MGDTTEGGGLGLWIYNQIRSPYLQAIFDEDIIDSLCNYI